MQIRRFFYIPFKYMVYVCIICKYYETFLQKSAGEIPTYFYVSFFYFIDAYF